MAQLIDLRTVILMATLLGGLMGLVLAFLARGTPHPVLGLKEWTRATWLALVTSILFGLRDFLPVALSVTLANVVLVAAMLTYLKGSHRYLNSAMRWSGWWPLCAVGFVGLVWFAHVQPSFKWRMAFVLGVMIAVMGAHAWLYWQHQTRTFGRRFLFLVTFAMTLVFALRWTHALWLSQDNDQLYAPTGVQSIYMSSYTVMLLLMTVGFVLLASERMREAFEYQATHDALTGAFNRRAVLERLTHELSRSNRYQRAFSVLMLDLDHFKRVNDQHGHQVGDEVLKLFVQRVGSILRPNDILGRWGGEEFLVLLPETSATAAHATATRVLLAVAKASDALPVCTTSIGVTTWQPQDTKVDVLVDRADQAMYAAKANGRNRVEVV